MECVLSFGGQERMGAFSVVSVLWLDSTVLLSYICFLNFHCNVQYWATILKPSRGFKLRSHPVHEGKFITHTHSLK